MAPQIRNTTHQSNSLTICCRKNQREKQENWLNMERRIVLTVRSLTLCAQWRTATQTNAMHSRHVGSHSYVYMTFRVIPSMLLLLLMLLCNQFRWLIRIYWFWDEKNWDFFHNFMDYCGMSFRIELWFRQESWVFSRPYRTPCKPESQLLCSAPLACIISCDVFIQVDTKSRLSSAREEFLFSILPCVGTKHYIEYTNCILYTHQTLDDDDNDIRFSCLLWVRPNTHRTPRQSRFRESTRRKERRKINK